MPHTEPTSASMHGTLERATDASGCDGTAAADQATSGDSCHTESPHRTSKCGKGELGLILTSKHVEFPDDGSAQDAASNGAGAVEPSLHGYLADCADADIESRSGAGVAPLEEDLSAENAGESDIPVSDTRTQAVASFAVSAMMGLGAPSPEVSNPVLVLLVMA